VAGQTLDQLPKYWTIGKAEHLNVVRSLRASLSGYVGGKPTTGYWVRKLADDWGRAFGVHHAIPCNSATSGLLAACMAAGIGYGDEVWVSTYTMSATAAAAMTLGATVHFADIDPTYFCMNLAFSPQRRPKAIIVTNLFGCAAELLLIREICNQFNIIMIEDNAQAPFATTYTGRLAGTIGHMGVFSLNVHKHLQCGEGGVIVTNDSGFAFRLEAAINHGELIPECHDTVSCLGLNLRMVESTAAIACAQLKKGFDLVQTRIDLAEAISDIFKDIPFVSTPVKRHEEIHAYYMWAGKINGDNARDIRDRFVTGLVNRGVPFRIGYSPLLHKLFGEEVVLPVAEDIENNRLFTFEVCAYDPKTHHLNRMRDIIMEEADAIQIHRHKMPPLLEQED
jgi:perosamine synthetase